MRTAPTPISTSYVLPWTKVRFRQAVPSTELLTSTIFTQVLLSSLPLLEGPVQGRRAWTGWLRDSTARAGPGQCGRAARARGSAPTRPVRGVYRPGRYSARCAGQI